MFSWFLSLTTYLAWQRVFPYLFDDEYGVLGAAAVLSGLEWVTPQGMPFYGFVLSLLVAPFYKLDLDPTTLYRVALSINGFFVAASAWLALHTVRRASPETPETVAILAVLAAFSYPAVVFYAGLALGETVLLFSLMLTIYGMTRVTSRQGGAVLGGVLFGTGLALAPYAHSRGLAFSLAAIPVVLIAMQAKWVTPRTAVTAMVAAVPVVLMLSTTKTWLIANFYSVVRAGTGSATDFASTRLWILAPEYWSNLLVVAYGQFSYLASASFGLLLVGIGGIIAITLGLRDVDRGNSSRVTIDDTKRVRIIIAAFVGLSLLGIMALSAISLGMPSHSNHYFYGRYNEVMIPVMIIIAILTLDRVGKKNHRSFLGFWSAAILVSVLSVFFIRWFPDAAFEKPTYWTQITAWFPFASDQWKIRPHAVASGVAIGGMILFAASLIGRRWAYVVLVSLFLASALHTSTSQHGLADIEGRDYSRLNRAYAGTLEGTNIAITRHPVWGALPAEKLQFSLPQSRVHFTNSEIAESRVVFDMSGTECDGNDSIWVSESSRFCVYDRKVFSEMQAENAVTNGVRIARTDTPARIEFGETIVAVGGFLQRTCAKAVPYFYLGWARYCLPTVNANVSHKGLTGEEHQELSVFVTDMAGEWLNEWRAPLDTRKLAAGKEIKVSLPIRFPSNLPAGNYRMHVTVFDVEGWDWRSLQSLDLIIR